MVDGVWLWSVELDAGADADAQDWLSASEHERAARFVFERDARRYRAAHVELRRLLWACCGWPRAAEFAIGEHGKPRLAQAQPHGFNLSHSGEQALIGIAVDPADDAGVGVDIELLRPLDDAGALAAQNFSVAENAALQRVPAADVARAFLNVWVRKEACVKAIGSGLSIAPASFHVGLELEPRQLRVHTEGGAVDVQVHSVDLGPGAVAAVARTAGSRQS